MTVMIPNSVPPGTTASEEAMFRLIRDATDSEPLTCLHSVGIARHRRKDYAEADFVIIAPSGVYCLEVKGGHVERHQGTWRIGWPDKAYISKEGPFKQAQGARWGLLDYLDMRLGKTLRKETTIGWGVAFPDICFDLVDPEWELEVVYDQRDKAHTFGRYIERLSAYFSRRALETGRQVFAPLSPSRRLEIVNALRGDFNVVPSLRGLLIESERELVALSSDQHRVLDYALNDHNHRILCDGPAGTGKTLIALEAARRLAAMGQKVLLLCFNDNLARFLRLDMSQSGARVETSTLHAFMGGIIRRGGFEDILRGLRSEGDPQQLFGKDYPQLFESACSALLDEDELPQYDAIVIDEAQDILAVSLMNCLDLVLTGGFSKGKWLVFYDSGVQSAMYQRIEPKLLERLSSFGATRFELRENFRNPKEVAQEACFMANAPAPICRRRLSSPVDYRTISDEKDQARKLRALLLDLLREGVAPGSVSILSPRRIPDSCVGRFPPDIGKRFRLVNDATDVDDDAFTVGTIAGFKGLENDIVILTDLFDGPADDRNRADLYTGITRTRTKLFAFVGNPYLYARTPR